VLEAVCVTLDVKPGKVKDETGKMVGGGRRGWEYTWCIL
jgi:hypothetical protein